MIVNDLLVRAVEMQKIYNMYRMKILSIVILVSWKVDRICVSMLMEVGWGGMGRVVYGRCKSMKWLRKML